MFSRNKKFKFSLFLAIASFGLVSQAHAVLNFCGGQNVQAINFYYSNSTGGNRVPVNGNINVSHTQGLVVPSIVGPQPVCPVAPPYPTGPTSCGHPDWTFRNGSCYCNKAFMTVEVDATSLGVPYPTQSLSVTSMIFFDPTTTISNTDILNFQHFPDTTNPSWLVSYQKILSYTVPGAWAASLRGAHAASVPINPVSGLATVVVPFETEYNPGGAVGTPGNWTNHAFFTAPPVPAPALCDIFVGRSPNVTFVP